MKFVVEMSSGAMICIPGSGILVSGIKGGTQTEGVEENIWTKEG
jgi:hypothetical protein